jgi:Beta protein
MKNYFPILVSKSGETGALQDDICPVIEVINPTLIKYKKDKEKDEKIMSYSDKFEKFLKTHWNFFNNQIILDFSLFENWHEHSRFILQTLIRLLDSGVNVVLSVQTNSPKLYKDIVYELILNYDCSLCFRFSNSSGGFVHINTDIKELMEEYSIETDSVVILVDLGQIDSSNYNNIGSSAGVQLMNLDYDLHQFKSLVIASSSFPANLGGFKPSEEEQTMVRYEWSLFNNVARGDLKLLKYGDYGTKTAIFADFPFMGSISLKYSSPKEFVIYRGLRTIDHRLGHNQFIAHSKKLIKTEYYSGNEFSWGDLRYYEISLQDLESGSSGNSTQWVEFSQNHHITLMHSIL